MNKNFIKTALPCFLLSVGIGLWAFGIKLNAVVVLPKEGTEGEPVQAVESYLMQQVTIGGLARDDQGMLRKTYGDAEEAPLACPT